MSTPAPDSEAIFEIVAEVDIDDPRAATLGTCIYCGYGPPICYGAALFVNCTGPRPPYTNADRMEDVEAHRPMGDGGSLYTDDGA